MYLAQYYPELRGQIGLKINELIRSYNSSSMQLIVCGGAVVLGAIRSKNITAKNLALSNLCLAFLRYLLSCVGTRVQVHESAAVTKDLE